MANGSNGVVSGTSPLPSEPAAPAGPPPKARTSSRGKRAETRPRASASASASAPATAPASSAQSPAPTPAPASPAPEPPAAAAPAAAQPTPRSVWFQPLPPMEPEEGPWEDCPTTLFYSAEANDYRTVSGLVVAAPVAWGGGISAFMLRPRDPMRVRLHNGTIWEVPDSGAFVAVPAIAELAAILTEYEKTEKDPNVTLAVRFKPSTIKLLEDGRPTLHYYVQWMVAPIPREQALRLP